MTIFCKYIRCLRLAKDGKRACRRHQCSVENCNQAVHYKCTTCFGHFQNTTKTFFPVSNAQPEIVFSGGKIMISDDFQGNNMMFGSNSFGSNSFDDAAFVNF